MVLIHTNCHLYLVYEITDRHLPRGFVTSRKPSTNIFCNYIYCDYTNYTNTNLNNCSVYTHVWTWLLQSLSTNSKSKSVNALKESMIKRLNEMNLSKITKIQLMMIWVMLNQQQ